MPKKSEKTDAQLVALTLEDQSHFEHLVQRYEKKLLRYIRRITGCTQENPEDILQEVFINIYLNLNDFDQDLSFSSWAYRIAHNKSVDTLRKSSKERTVPLETDDEEAGNLIEVLKSEIDVAADVSKKDVIERIRRAIMMLPEKYREVLILRYIEDMEYKEISDILKIPMSTVATLVNRAKQKFKEIAKKENLESLMEN